MQQVSLSPAVNFQYCYMNPANCNHVLFDAVSSLANNVIQEFFLDSIIDILENAPEHFGVKRVWLGQKHLPMCLSQYEFVRHLRFLKWTGAFIVLNELSHRPFL